MKIYSTDQPIGMVKDIPVYFDWDKVQLGFNKNLQAKLLIKSVKGLIFIASFITIIFAILLDLSLGQIPFGNLPNLTSTDIWIIFVVLVLFGSVYLPLFLPPLGRQVINISVKKIEADKLLDDETLEIINDSLSAQGNIKNEIFENLCHKNSKFMALLIRRKGLDNISRDNHFEYVDPKLFIENLLTTSVSILFAKKLQSITPNVLFDAFIQID